MTTKVRLGDRILLNTEESRRSCLLITYTSLNWVCFANKTQIFAFDQPTIGSGLGCGIYPAVLAVVPNCPTFSLSCLPLAICINVAELQWGRCSSGVTVSNAHLFKHSVSL